MKGYTKKIDGLDAYDIMRIHGCPISLPTARSMTQASIDFYSRQDAVIDWYIKEKKKKRI